MQREGMRDNDNAQEFIVVRPIPTYSTPRESLGTFLKLILTCLDKPFAKPRSNPSFVAPHRLRSTKQLVFKANYNSNIFYNLPKHFWQCERMRMMLSCLNSGNTSWEMLGNFSHKMGMERLSVGCL